MRLFTAIDLPAGIKLRLSALLERLRPMAKLSWTVPEHLHVTIKFIGEWPDPRLDEMKRALAAVPRPGPIELAVRGLGWFPDDRNPRVFWAGIEASPKLYTLAHDTGQSLASLGVVLETREFHPHLTLARRKNPVPIDRLRREIAEISSADFGGVHSESFFLYLSKGGKYVKLNEFPLISI